jgi:type I restriction enzyme S subunit
VKWPTKSLGAALASAELFTDGDWVESKDQDPNGDVRLTQLADVGDGEYLDKSNRFLTATKARELGCTFLKQGDVMIARMPDPLGRACIFPGDEKPAVTVVDVCVIRPDHREHDSRWLMHCLNTIEVRRQISGFASGTTRSRISRGNLAKIRIPLPSIAEQRRIAEVLDRADALRAKRRAALAQLDSLTQSILEDAVVGSANSSRSVPLADLAEPTRGSFVNGPFGSDLLTSELQETGVPVIYIRDIRDGEYSRVSKSCVTERKAKELSVCQVVGGDVLIAKVGDPPGVAAVYPQNEPPAIVTQDVIRIRLSNKVATPEYVAAYLNSSRGRSAIAGITIQATRARFPLGPFKRLAIAVPPIGLQREFARRVAVVERMKASQRAALAKLDELFASLQHRAFRGEL